MGVLKGREGDIAIELEDGSFYLYSGNMSIAEPYKTETEAFAKAKRISNSNFPSMR